uniref:SET domain-containing protein n=1 Tax=Steinernema glaseri TaxID=37863 RepID=A0A1I8AIL7_9BILA
MSLYGSAERTIFHLSAMLSGNDEKIDAFIEWIQQQQVSTDCVDLKFNAEIGGNGIYAKKDLRSGEVLLELPVDVLITSSTAMDHPECSAMIRGANVKLSPSEAIALLFIVEDKKSDSFYAPYFAMLPRTFNTPLFQGIDIELNELPRVERATWVRQQKEITALYDKIPKIRPGTTKEEMLWAWHVVNTRCIFVENLGVHEELDNSEGDKVAVIPFVDMLNHSPDPSCEAKLRKAGDIYEVVSHKSIAEGSEIFVTYGYHTNVKLWMEYGFQLPGNLMNKIDISLDLFIALVQKCSMTLHPEIVQILNNADLLCTIYASDDDLSCGFKTSIRILFLRMQEFHKWNRVVYDEEVDDDINEKISDLCRKMIHTLRHHLVKRRDDVSEAVKFAWQDQIDILDAILETKEHHYLQSNCAADK